MSPSYIVSSPHVTVDAESMTTRDLVRIERIGTVNADAVSIGVLGPLTVSVGGRPVALTAGRLRTLLAVLALAVGEPVPVDRLAIAVWGDDLPADPKRGVQIYVTRLRSALGPDAIGTTPAGYLLQTAADQVDAARFVRLLDAAATATDAGSERANLVEALGLWRGTPFEDVRSAWLEQMESPGLIERYLGALERRIDLDLDDGHHGWLVPQLRELTVRHPYRERLWGQLMLALYRSGRQGDALEAYLALYRLLADELGIEPGEPVRELHQRILAADPALDPGSGPGPAGQPVPRQLPAGIGEFIGRAANLSRLDALLPTGDTDAAPAVVISAIAGTAGVGKTTLALHWARRVADRFPDGQLYVNLRGFDPDASAMGPAEAARGFLEALGVAPDRIPADLREQADLYRSLVADRRMLIVLDNARNAEQVRPLLPGAPGCVVVVTSRNQLSSLVAVEGAHPIVLDLLTPAEARDFLAARLGPDRVAAERRAVEEIIGLCARLPLALAVVAARAATHPEFRLAALADELRAARRPLDALAGDEPITDLRAVFSWSYRVLTPAAARLFRLLAVDPAADIPAAAAACLAGLPPASARALMSELTQTNLVMEHAPGRYTFHDLLRSYAADLVHRVDSGEDRRAALIRLVDYYLHTAHAADRLISPTRDGIPLPLAPPAPGAEPTPLADQDEAVAWLIGERSALRAIVRLDTDASFDTRIWQLAWSLYTIFKRQGSWHDLSAAGQRALRAAERLRQPAARATAHYFLAVADGFLGRLAEADVHCQRAIDLYRRSGDLIGQANTHNHLGMLAAQRGRPAEAREQAQQALALFQAAGHRFGEAKALNAVGWCYTLLGEHEQAIVHCGRALVLFQELGDRETEAAAWNSLGHAHHHLGRFADAVDCFERALDLVRLHNDRFRQATVLDHLGDTLHAAGNRDGARAAWQQALTILDDSDRPHADTVRAKLRAPSVATSEPQD
jgi:DNA-binding SARP family transcriptional activator/tetratricopeptide (TPR) repeat protein